MPIPSRSQFRLVGKLPATVEVGPYSYLIHLDDTGARSFSYLTACGIDTWILADTLPENSSGALEILRRGFTPPFDGKSTEICEALVRGGVFEDLR